MSAFAAAVMVMLTAAPAPGVVEGTVHFEEKTLFGTNPVQGGEAVVFVEHTDEAPPAPPKTHPQLRQQNKTFQPKLLVVTEGTEVEFPNDDVVFHNVFSLSRGNQFDLGVYRQGSSKTVRFSNAGVVDVFCNIHPDMIASIVVVQNSHFARVGEDGKFKLQLPPGKYTLVAYWAKGVTERKDVEVAPGGKTTWDVTLVDGGDRARHLNKHGQQYGRYK